MDEGSSLNILYAHTLELMGIGLNKLRPSKSPFHGVAPGRRVQPLGQIDLPVCFGTAANFRKEVLTFEVVGFRGSYHAILGRPCYAKFMAIPNYTYLKLKMPGPRGVITVGSCFQHAYQCEEDGCEIASAIVASKELTLIRAETTEEAPDSNRKTGSFEPAEGVKEIALDPQGSGNKKLRVGAKLTPK